MPHPQTRRAFLRAALGLTGVAATASLAGCDLLAGPASGEVPPHELDGLLAETVDLRDRYTAAIDAVPELEGTLSQVRDAHRAHADALAAALGRSVPSSAGGAGSAPAGRAEAIAALVAAEKAARDDALAACVAASGRLAPLLGSIAAARASHLEVVR